MKKSCLMFLFFLASISMAKANFTFRNDILTDAPPTAPTGVVHLFFQGAFGNIYLLPAGHSQVITGHALYPDTYYSAYPVISGEVPSWSSYSLPSECYQSVPDNATMVIKGYISYKLSKEQWNVYCTVLS